MRKRRVHSIQTELLSKSKECTLAAVKIYNDPLIQFKSESFTVLMIIGWTYLLHSYYRANKIEYRYHEVKKGRKKFDKTKRGSYKYWELERCLNDTTCPLDKDAKNNLKFLIGLRHEIEHQMTLSLDDYISGRYQACIINFNKYLVALFGKEQSLEKHLSYSLQFIELSNEQIQGSKPEAEIPNNLKAYIIEFDKGLTEEEYNSPSYSFRLLFSRKLVNRPGQADKVIEFIDPKSELAKTIDKEYWVKREVERKKFLPSKVIKVCQDAGFKKFRMTQHTEFWKKENAKEPSKSFGTQVENTWYWYQNWIDRCIEYCTENSDTFK
jgi:hypothetical protein